MTDRDEFVVKLKTKLDDWNADIDHLEGQAKTLGAKVRSESHGAVQKLRNKRDKINEGLAELGRSAGDAWKDLREGLDEAAADLHAGIVDAKNRFTHHDTKE